MSGSVSGTPCFRLVWYSCDGALAHVRKTDPSQLLAYLEHGLDLLAGHASGQDLVDDRIALLLLLLLLLLLMLLWLLLLRHALAGLYRSHIELYRMRYGSDR